MALRDVKRRKAGMQKSQCFQGFSARYEKRQQTMIGPHNPKVVGSNPSSATIKDCTFVYHDKSAVFSHFRAKQVKNAVNKAKMGFGAVNETAPKPIFYFRSRKIAKKSAVLFVSFSSVKTYRLRGSERI